MTAQALIAAGGDVERFRHILGWRLRFWLLGMPAGIGLATLRACIKLCLGFSPSRSGVYSAGNGPAMRAAILGTYECADTQKLWELVKASSRITHTDPRAEQGAMAVAMAASFCVVGRKSGFSATEYLIRTRPFLHDSELARNLTIAERYASQEASPEQFAKALGKEQGISGFINHTVPTAIFCWLRYRDDFHAAVEAAILLGGDTDTVGAIVGGLVGIGYASEAPPTWQRGMVSSRWLWKVAEPLGVSQITRKPMVPPYRLWPVVFCRNVFFASIVLLHGFRRLLPPY